MKTILHTLRKQKVFLLNEIYYVSLGDALKEMLSHTLDK